MENYRVKFTVLQAW